MGDAKLTALIQKSLLVATRTEAMKTKDLVRVVVDTTVQTKAVMFPTDAKLLNRAARTPGTTCRAYRCRAGADQASALYSCPTVQAPNVK